MWSERLLYRGADARLASEWTDVAGLRLHVRAGGPPDARHTIVLVHGIGVSSRYLVPTAARLAKRYRVLVPDLPGSGRSPRPPRPLDVDGLATTLAGLLDARGVERASFVANSFGCQIVTCLAAREPEKVASLVLVAPTIDPHARSFLRQSARLARDGLREPPGLWLIVAVDYATFALRGQLPLVRTMLADRIEERLPRMTAPALVVRGGRDPVVPQRWAEEAAALLPNGRLLVLPSATHAANYTAPSELAAAVENLVATHRVHHSPGAEPSK
jgi:pimeloyl-ACP methyl ester carboxylesterase